MKFLLQPAPTFEAPVPIPVPGKGDVDIVFTFKYRDADEAKAFAKREKEKKRPDVDYIMQLASGWNLDEEFNKKNLAILFKNYPSAPLKISTVYFAELAGVRRKN